MAQCKCQAAGAFSIVPLMDTFGHVDPILELGHKIVKPVLGDCSKDLKEMWSIKTGELVKNALRGV